MHRNNCLSGFCMGSFMLSTDLEVVQYGAKRDHTCITPFYIEKVASCVPCRCCAESGSLALDFFHYRQESTTTRRHQVTLRAQVECDFLVNGQNDPLLGFKICDWCVIKNLLCSHILDADGKLFINRGCQKRIIATGHRQ